MAFGISLLSLENIISSVVAWSDVHLKYLLIWKFLKFLSFRTVHLSLFSVRPDIFERISNVVTGVWNDFFSPSVIEQASSTKRVGLSSIFPIFIPEIFLFKLISFESNSMQIINKYGDKGQPCHWCYCNVLLMTRFWIEYVTSRGGEISKMYTCPRTTGCIKAFVRTMALLARKQINTKARCINIMI